MVGKQTRYLLTERPQKIILSHFNVEINIPPVACPFAVLAKGGAAKSRNPCKFLHCLHSFDDMSTPLEAVQPIQTQPMIPSSRRVGYAAMTVARYFLGLAMMPYAIDKLLAYQFKVPAWSYAQPLGATSGNTLAWATY